MEKPSIAIVTVLYNSESVLEDFFLSLDKQLKCDLTLYVVDNCSPDDSLEKAKQLSSKVSFPTNFIENTRNYGVAKGNNQGIHAALSDGFEYVLLSNNDVVIEPDCISKLFMGMDASKLLLAVPKIYFFGTNLIWTAGGGFDKKTGGVLHRGSRQEDAGQFELQEIIDYAPTCFMLIHKKVFSIVGDMDEKYFVYFDDTDFIYRCRKNNLPIAYIPQAILSHKESTSTGLDSDFTAYHYWRNFIYFNKKNRGISGLYYIAMQFCNHLLRRFFILPRNRWKLILHAMCDGSRM